MMLHFIPNVAIILMIIFFTPLNLTFWHFSGRLDFFPQLNSTHFCSNHCVISLGSLAFLGLSNSTFCGKLQQKKLPLAIYIQHKESAMQISFQFCLCFLHTEKIGP